MIPAQEGHRSVSSTRPPFLFAAARQKDGRGDIMIYKRVAARLRAQDWVAISIEIVIVIIGVFVGTWVANWNQQRSEKRDIDQLLVQMKPELTRMRVAGQVRQNYYATTRGFANIALAGWAGDPKVSDRNFVVAAYQASQITGISSGSPLVTSVLGGDQVRKIDDPALRAALLRLINFPYDAIGASGMQTRYREDVRQTIPDDIQQAVRRSCGDHPVAEGMMVLPTACTVVIAPGRAAAGASQLRGHPELIRELRFHLSQVANFQFNSAELSARVVELERLLDIKFGNAPAPGAG
jgi:hypothetical protein